MDTPGTVDTVVPRPLLALPDALLGRVVSPSLLPPPGAGPGTVFSPLGWLRMVVVVFVFEPESSPPSHAGNAMATTIRRTPATPSRRTTQAPISERSGP